MIYTAWTCSTERYLGKVENDGGDRLVKRSFDLWDKEDAIIACAIQNGDPRLGGHISQLLVARRKRTPDRTIDAQLVRGEIPLCGREMTVYVEQLRRSEKQSS
jgi:hypothetical protein